MPHADAARHLFDCCIDIKNFDWPLSPAMDQEDLPVAK
jgi:hypothetical protein